MSTSNRLLYLLLSFFFLLTAPKKRKRTIVIGAQIHFRLNSYFALPSKDIHYVAHDKGELVLADVAKKKANEIDAESLTSGWGKRIILSFLFFFPQKDRERC